MYHPYRAVQVEITNLGPFPPPLPPPCLNSTFHDRESAQPMEREELSSSRLVVAAAVLLLLITPPRSLLKRAPRWRLFEAHRLEIERGAWASPRLT
ncbi:hypothetical protein B296_00033345 [Ensete ventricosum]|uniref:Uncharacterized protein n=1 Tax=Ensete ventricosum TaxID=4639 RepID=A0A426Z5E2_ENSVE|nr:hypothetical protein B296_00033345 [Ensete ventricosum]